MYSSPALKLAICCVQMGADITDHLRFGKVPKMYRIQHKSRRKRADNGGQPDLAR